MKKITPLNDRVIIRRVAAEEKTAGGIFIPDNAKEKPLEGEVIAAGPGRCSEQGVRVPTTVKVGDKVLYSKYAGTEAKVGDEELLILTEGDILGIIEE